MSKTAGFALVCFALVQGVVGQAIDRTEVSLQAYGGDTSADTLTNRQDFTIEVTTSGAMETTFDIEMKTQFHENNNEVGLNGFWIGVVDPQLLCSSEGESPGCLEDPLEGSSYPDDSYYFEQASRKIFVSLNNINVRSRQSSGSFCGASLHDSFCSDKTSCDALGWSTSSLRNEAIKKQIVDEAVLPLTTQEEQDAMGVTAVMGLRSRDDVTIDRLSYRGFSQTFQLTVPEDIFVMDEDVDKTRFSLKSSTGERIIFTWGLMASDTFQGGCANGVTHQDFASSTPYLKQLLRQTSDRADVYDMFVQTTIPPTLPPTTPPTAAPSDAPTPPTVAPSEAPTVSPIVFGNCPHERRWELCSRLNTGFRYLAKKPARRRRKIGRDCRKKGCQWCGDNYDSTESCRPDVRSRADGGGLIPLEVVCPVDESNKFRDNCDFLPNCPLPAAMSACRNINAISVLNNMKRRSKRSALCQGRFRYEGKRFGRRTCLYANGQCGAAGDYFFARRTISRIPFFFTGQPRSCAFEEDSLVSPAPP